MDPPPPTFGPIGGRDVIAGTHVSGGTLNVMFNNSGGSSQSPSPCRLIPFPRNEDVVNRDHIFAELDKLLPPSSKSQSAALWGLGGSGKTQVALEYAYRRSQIDSSCSIFWVHADSVTTFTQDYKLIGMKLGVDNSLDGTKLLAAVCERITASASWLLILDNADDLSLFGVGQKPQKTSQNDTADEVRNLYEFIPHAITGTVLWTSRDQRICGTLVGAKRAINVARMTDGEAKALFESVRAMDIKEDEAADADQLLRDLEWLPLAISQSAAYIRRTSVSIKEYLSMLSSRRKRWRLLERTEFDRHRRPHVSNSILGTWDISIEHIQHENRLSYNILHILAFLDNQNIPFEIIWQIAVSKDVDEAVSDGQSIKSTDLAAGVNANVDNEDDDNDENFQDIIDAIARLQEFSFLHVRKSEDNSRAFEMHKLVQEATRYSLGRESRHAEEVFFSKTALEVVDALFPRSQPESWDECEKYLTHAQQVCEWAELCEREQDASNLLSEVSYYLYHRARWREKEPVNKRAHKLREKILGDKHPQTISSIASLATTYHALGRYEEAMMIETEVLALRKEILGERHIDTIEGMASLAATYHALGRYEEARMIETEVLALRKEILGERHIDTIEGMASLAATYYTLGRYEEARMIKTEVLSLRKEILGERHIDTIEGMASLAATYHTLGRYEEARMIKTEVLSLRKEILGERHLDTIEGMASLATIYHTLGRYKEARMIKTEVLSLRKEILGERHPATIDGMASLAATYHILGRYEEAMMIKTEVLSLREELLGHRHPDTVTAMSDLATIYHEQRRYSQAEKMEVEVLALREELLGHRHPDTVQAMSDLARIYHQQRRYSQAEKMEVEVLALREELLGHRHPDTIQAMSDLATIYHQQRRYSQAEKIDVEVLALREELLGHRHPNTVKSMSKLAATYHQQERYEEDEKLSAEVLAILKEILGGKHPDTLDAMHGLAVTWYSRGQYSKAVALMTECFQLRSDVLGIDHLGTQETLIALQVWEKDGQKTKPVRSCGWHLPSILSACCL